jgi:rSAM/selenodomain-associated transferase 1
MTKRVLGLFAKWPEPGRVKTRLAAVTSPAFAADLAFAFLRDAAGRFAAASARRVLAFAPADAGPRFAAVVGDRFALVPQADGDLGRRLSAFITAEVAAGAEAVVVVGTDSPTLPPSRVEDAFAELRQADVVLGPATDGGYYLVGCGRRLPPIFDGMAWGGPTVFADSVARLADPAWRLARLPPWYDVDTLDDYRELRSHIVATRRAGLDPGAPHTEALCRDNPL